MVKTDGKPTIAWADPEHLDSNRDHGDESTVVAVSCPLTRLQHIHKVELTDEEIGLLVEALDSHVYWQLSNESFRSDGYVDEPGSDDPEVAHAITEAHLLENKLASIIAGHTT